MTATMSWELDREHEEFRASVRSFVDRQVRPVVEESEEPGRPSAALLKEMGCAGLLGLAVPEEDGGAAAHPLPALRLVTVQSEPLDGDTFASAARHLVTRGAPQGDTSAMEDLAGLQAVQQAVAAEAAPSA